jgi:hypothetical protein
VLEQAGFNEAAANKPRKMAAPQAVRADGFPAAAASAARVAPAKTAGSCPQNITMSNNPRSRLRFPACERCRSLIEDRSARKSKAKSKAA